MADTPAGSVDAVNGMDLATAPAEPHPGVEHAVPATALGRRLAIAVGINSIIVVAQVVTGVLAHSLALLSDAGHNLTDVLALIVALVAWGVARRPATSRHSFGFGRATVLAAQANSAAILALTVWITITGIQRLIHPTAVDGPLMLISAGVAFVANSAAVLVVRGAHGGHGHGGHSHVGGDHDSHGDHGPGDDETAVSQPDDLNMRAAMLHLISDAAASLGVVIVGVVIWRTSGWYWLDPAVSLAIGLLIGIQGWRLLRTANTVLLEGTPSNLDTDDVITAVREVPGVLDIHDVHMWSISAEFASFSAHLVLASDLTLRESEEIVGLVRHLLARQFAITHATLETETMTSIAFEAQRVST